MQPGSFPSPSSRSRSPASNYPYQTPQQQQQQRSQRSQGPLHVSPVPGLESRALQPNPQYFKSASLARSRNSIAPATSLGSSSTPPTSPQASVSALFTPQQLAHFGGDGRGIERGASPSISSSAPSSRGDAFFKLPRQRRLVHSRDGLTTTTTTTTTTTGGGAAGSSGKRSAMSSQVEAPRQLRATRGGGGGGGSAAVARPVNYNELLHREQNPPPPPPQQQQQQQQRGGGGGGAEAVASSFPPEDPRSRLMAYRDGGNSSPIPHTQQQQQQPLPSSSGPTPGASGRGGGGVLEGPLPSEVRALIQSHFLGGTGGGIPDDATAAAIEEAERQARRLLSTSRRSKIYREELQAAREEAADLAGVVEQHQLVSGVLSQEMADIDAKIEQLMRERALCETQLQQQAVTMSRQQGKLDEARERVTVLTNTIDGIGRDVQAGQVVLRQLVPGLNIENYL